MDKSVGGEWTTLLGQLFGYKKCTHIFQRILCNFSHFSTDPPTDRFIIFFFFWFFSSAPSSFLGVSIMLPFFYRPLCVCGQIFLFTKKENASNQLPAVARLAVLALVDPKSKTGPHRPSLSSVHLPSLSQFPCTRMCVCVWRLISDAYSIGFDAEETRARVSISIYPYIHMDINGGWKSGLHSFNPLAWGTLSHWVHAYRMGTDIEWNCTWSKSIYYQYLDSLDNAGSIIFHSM